MVKLPDQFSLGEIPDPYVRVPVPTASEVDAGAIGRAMQHFGSAVGDVSTALANHQNQNNALELAKADTAYKVGIAGLSESLANDPDPDTHVQRYNEGEAALRQQSKSMFSKPEKGDLWEQHAIPHGVNTGIGVGRYANGLIKERQSGEFDDTFKSALTHFYANPTSENLTALEHHVDNGEHSGLLNPKTARQYRADINSAMNGVYLGVGAPTAQPQSNMPGGAPGIAPPPANETIEAQGGEPTEQKPDQSRLVSAPAKPTMQPTQVSTAPEQPAQSSVDYLAPYAGKSNIKDLNPDFRQRVVSALSDMPENLRSTIRITGYRNDQEQHDAIVRHLRAAGMPVTQANLERGIPGVVAGLDFNPDGSYTSRSRHSVKGENGDPSGEAVDITGSDAAMAWLHRKGFGTQYGFENPANLRGSDPVHFQMTGGAGQDFSSRTGGVINAPTRQAIADVSGAYGFKPGVLPSLINLESGWNTKNSTGSYSGLTQMGKDTFDEAGGRLAGLTYSQYLNAGPADQIKAYGAWLQHYGFSDKMQRNGIDFANLPPEKQAAVLQAFQFGPNDERWMEAAGRGDWHTPVTNTKQADALGDTSLSVMSQYYGGQVRIASAQTGTATDASRAPRSLSDPALPDGPQVDMSKVPDWMRERRSPFEIQQLERIRQSQVAKVDDAVREQAESSIRNDIARLKDGVPVAKNEAGLASIDALRDRFQGPKGQAKISKLGREWNVAQYEHNLKAPLTGMSYSDGMAWIANNDPRKLDSKDFDYEDAKVAHDEVQHYFEQLHKVRNDDAARSVSGFQISKMSNGAGIVPPAPEVQAAMEEARTGGTRQFDGSIIPYTHQQRWGVLFKGRLAAQEKAGLDEGQQRVLTVPESEQLLNMDISHIPDGNLLTEKLDEAAARAKVWFGPENAERGLRDAIAVMMHKTEQRDAATNALSELATYRTLQPATIAALQNQSKLDPLSQYIRRQQVMGARVDTTLPVPAVAATGFGEMPPSKQDIKDLRMNPANWRNFDSQFGDGAAARALMSPDAQYDKSAYYPGNSGGYDRPIRIGHQLSAATRKEAANFTGRNPVSIDEIRQQAGSGADPMVRPSANYMPEPEAQSLPRWAGISRRDMPQTEKSSTEEPATPFGGHTAGGYTIGGVKPIGSGQRFGGKRYGASAIPKTMEAQ
jgi:hypothetical protein